MDYYCTKCQMTKDEKEFYPSRRTNKGSCKTCFRACKSQSPEGKKEYHDANPDKTRQWKQTSYNKHRNQFIYLNAQRKAQEKNLAFEIDIEDIVMPEKCPILGIPIIIECGKGRNDNSPVIDMINSRLGYIKNNIRIISDRAYRLKGDASIEELLLLVQNV